MSEQIGISVVSVAAEKSVKDPERLARMVLREGKSFKSSAMECGYSPATAAKGVSALVRDSSAVATAFNRVTAEMMVGLDKLKPLAVARLHAEIVNVKSSLGIKAIEVAGRFKETDWFVKNNADVQIGVFAGFAEPDTIDVGSYEEKPPEEP